jgi:ABC-type amino acid transport substrate-binding protein
MTRLTTTLSAGMASALLLVAALSVAPGNASAGTLDRIREKGVIRIAYREDAVPFSFKDNLNQPAGFMVELCQAVAKDIAQQMNLASLNVAYVSVTATNRFQAIQMGQADILCEPTSATLSRRKLVDFSLPTFVDGAGLMIRADGPKSLQELAGRKIGVLGGTTTEDALHNTLNEDGINADVVLAKTHAEGLAMLDDAKISAYFADHSILAFLIAKSKDPSKLMLADNYLTVEPYALALPRGDEDYRLAVDTALSHIYRSGQIATIFQHGFGGVSGPSPMLKTLYLITGLPE